MIRVKLYHQSLYYGTLNQNSWEREREREREREKVKQGRGRETKASPSPWGNKNKPARTMVKKP
jgi:hypothetical protein